MRSLWFSTITFGLILGTPFRAGAETDPKIAKMLGFQPILKNIEFDSPADAAAISACKTENVLNTQKKAVGVALRDGQGKLLRRVIDSDGDNKMDQWSYYQDGFEVYRESDQNQDLSPDECRWLNMAGTRIARVTRGKITGWKRISAEEASKVFVQGLVSNDLDLIETVLVTPEELTTLGVPKGEIEQVAKAAVQRAQQVRTLQKGLIGWNSKSVWNRLDGSMPHLIPADPLTGVTQDMILYENAVIFAGPPSAQTASAPAKVAFLQVPEMLKIGENWKLVELPRAIDPEKPVMAAEGGIRSWIFRQQGGGQENGNPEQEAALKVLADYDNANAKVQVDGGKKELAQFHVGRIPLLRGVIKATQDEEQRLTFNRQIVDSLAAAYQTGLYPNALKLLDAIAGEGGRIASYAAFRKISAVFAVKNDEPGANLMVNQKSWMGELKAFLKAHPKSDEAAEALIQLAGSAEFNAEEDEARKYYEQLASEFPTTDAGKKAAGAIRRLDLVGKSITIRGPSLDGPEIDTARTKGKTLLIMFWASWADPVRRDLPELVKVFKKYHAKDFEIVGVNFDNDRDELQTFLKSNPLPWPQIFEPGGMEKSRLAIDYGIIALPTMILVDAQGKVMNRSIRTAAELERQLEKGVAANQPGVALDR
ncbi:MAG: TlpA disulfide reductase family protein [Isosphaeraceae bacterium]